MHMKPVVDKNRKTKLLYIGGIVDIDGMTSAGLKELAEHLDELTSELNCEFVTEPKIKHTRYGYDDGFDIEFCGTVYDETEQQWKERVAAEESALKEWMSNLAEQLRKQLDELEGNEIGH